jgi:hypothetical protein
LSHLSGRQGRGLVLQRLSTTYQSLPKVLQQVVQHCRIFLPEESHDVVLASGGDVVHFAVAMLKAASLGLEGFKFRDAEASKAGYATSIFDTTMAMHRDTVTHALACTGKA